MQVMMRGITGKYASPVYGGEWGTGRSTLAYSPLFMLPLKKAIIDGREMGARTEHFAAPGRELKYWATPAESKDWSSWVEGISRNGPAYLVGVNELNLTSEGHLPRVDIQPAVNALQPFQIPPNAIKISLGKTEDYWAESPFGSVFDIVYRNTNHL